MNSSTRIINTYAAILIITIFGGGASLIIVHIASADYPLFPNASEAQYVNLQKSILGQ